MSLDWSTMRATVRDLGVSPSEVLLAGSAPLVAVGALDHAGDLDVVAWGEAWATLASRGTVREGSLGDRVVDLAGGLQVFSGWHGAPAVEVLRRAMTRDGLQVLSLSDVIAYKRTLDRDKDREHLRALARWASEMTDEGSAASGRPPRRLADRTHAGELLAARLSDPDLPRPVVLALPRGGVPVAEPVARALSAELDVLVVRKLGVPANPEYAFGAIGERGVSVVDPRIVSAAGLSHDEVEAVERAERSELDRRRTVYRPGRPELDLRGRTAVVVDDGSATGATARAAIAVARGLGAARIVVAVGACPPDILALLGREADGSVAALTPEPFAAVGQWYQDFAQTSDDEVRRLLGLA
ncbi:phosphoribosyltransferase [Demequina sp. NBRC 110053]|uniref:phosphoribosyltransferase n=1 Tax=Demequina sp. NBRC 110053 TaxID=1570342 RepID=UPI001F2FD3F2|nr:phosphoribosyltransferase family protein [Demequina sp. NBRC 110053]